MNKLTSILIGLSLTLGLFPSCGNKPKNTQAEQDYKRAARYFVADENPEAFGVYEATFPKKEKMFFMRFLHQQQIILIFIQLLRIHILMKL